MSMRIGHTLVVQLILHHTTMLRVDADGKRKILFAGPGRRSFQFVSGTLSANIQCRTSFVPTDSIVVRHRT